MKLNDIRDNDGARKAVAPEFERFDVDFRSVVGEAIQSQGGSVRQPLSVASLSTVLVALLDGLALREMLTPGAIAARDVATATESILRWAVDPLHSDRNTPAPEPTEDQPAHPKRKGKTSDTAEATEPKKKRAPAKRKPAAAKKDPK